MHMKVRQQGVCILIGRELHEKFIKSSKSLHSNSMMTNIVVAEPDVSTQYHSVPKDTRLSHFNSALSSRVLQFLMAGLSTAQLALSSVAIQQGRHPLYGEQSNDKINMLCSYNTSMS